MTEMKLFDFTHSHPLTSLELNIVVSRDIDPLLWCQLSLSLAYNVNFHFHFLRANHFASLPSCAAVWKEDGQFWMNRPPWIANVTLILTKDSLTLIQRWLSGCTSWHLMYNCWVMTKDTLLHSMFCLFLFCLMPSSNNEYYFICCFQLTLISWYRGTDE